MAKRLYTLTLVIFILIIPLAYVVFHYCQFLKTPLNPTQSIHLLFKPGSSVHHLLADLQSQGYLKKHVRFFLLLAYLKGATNKLKAGEYQFDLGTTPGQLIDQMLAGHVILHRFTIVEGQTLRQLIADLKVAPYVRPKLELASVEQLASTLGLSKKNPEGLFFPATYYFSLHITDRDLLKWSHQLLEKKLHMAWKLRAANLPYKTPYEALIVASMLEKETALFKERPMIAGVIIRRLERGMPLQIDASVIYGLGSAYTGKLSLADLHKDTPYNTYTRRGLPPTPIANPSLVSINAALHPDHSDNLYFVAKGNGSHQFSAQLTEHNLAVQIYQLGGFVPCLMQKRGNLSRCEHEWINSYWTKQLFCS